MQPFYASRSHARDTQYASPQLRGSAYTFYAPSYGPNAKELASLVHSRIDTMHKSDYEFHYRSDEQEWRAPLISMRCVHERCTRTSTLTLPYCKRHLANEYRLAHARTQLRDASGKRFRFYGLFAVGDPTEIVFDAQQDIVPYFGEQFRSASTLQKRYGDGTAIYGFVNHQTGVYTDGALWRGAAANINQASSATQNNAAFREHEPFDMIFALKPIYGGEEVLVDYGDAYEMDQEGVHYETRKGRRIRPALLDFIS